MSFSHGKVWNLSSLHAESVFTLRSLIFPFKEDLTHQRPTWAGSTSCKVRRGVGTTNCYRHRSTRRCLVLAELYLEGP